jgi:branched-chain amino acid transport system permease protein
MALMGLILVIEMTFRLMVRASDGTRMSFFGVPLDAAGAVAWIAAAVMLVGGFYLFRRTWPFVADAWQHAHGEMQRARRSAA